MMAAPRSAPSPLPSAARAALRSEWRLRSTVAAVVAPAPAAAAGSWCGSTTFPLVDALHVEVLREGRHERLPRSGDVCEVHYACLIARTGSCVDSSRSKAFTERGPYVVTLGTGQVVLGMEAGLRRLRPGALARLHVPPHMAYGKMRAGPIPPESHLVFEVEMLAIHAADGRGVGRGPSSAVGIDAFLLRRLLMIPVSPQVAAAAAAPSAAAASPPDEDGTVRNVSAGAPSLAACP